MAYKDTKWPGTDVGPFFYNVTNGVGYGHPNKRDDVLLVQYMLKRIYTTYLAAGFKVDGFFGPKTHAAIKKFQVDFSAISMSHGFQPLAQDGVVSHADNIGYSGEGGIVAYTITALNLEFKTKFPGEFPFVGWLVDTPPELKGKL